jgi:hypothetical protein
MEANDIDAQSSSSCRSAVRGVYISRKSFPSPEKIIFYQPWIPSTRKGWARTMSYVDRRTARTTLTILMYGGVLVFLLPYMMHNTRHGPMLMLGGAIVAVACGLLRCCFSEDGL